MKHLHLAKQAARLAGLAILLGTLPGCQSISGNTSLSQVRVIYASPDAGGVDIYENSNILAYNLGFGTVTSYVPVVPDTYTVSATQAGTKQQLISSRGTFKVNNQYTVLIGNFAAALQETILQDQAQSAPSGQISLRFLDQASAAGSVDIYLVTSGGTLMTSKPILTGVSFGANTGYINVPAGTYSIVALAAGTVPTTTTVASYSGPSQPYSGGGVWTVLLTNQTTVTNPALQVSIVNDYESPGTVG